MNQAVITQHTPKPLHYAIYAIIAFIIISGIRVFIGTPLDAARHTIIAGGLFDLAVFTMLCIAMFYLMFKRKTIAYITLALLLLFALIFIPIYTSGEISAKIGAQSARMLAPGHEVSIIVLCLLQSVSLLMALAALIAPQSRAWFQGHYEPRQTIKDSSQEILDAKRLFTIRPKSVSLSPWIVVCIFAVMTFFIILHLVLGLHFEHDKRAMTFAIAITVIWGLRTFRSKDKVSPLAHWARFSRTFGGLIAALIGILLMITAFAPVPKNYPEHLHILLMALYLIQGFIIFNLAIILIASVNNSIAITWFERVKQSYIASKQKKQNKAANSA